MFGQTTFCDRMPGLGELRILNTTGSGTLHPRSTPTDSSSEAQESQDHSLSQREEVRSGVDTQEQPGLWLDLAAQREWHLTGSS